MRDAIVDRVARSGQGDFATTPFDGLLDRETVRSSEKLAAVLESRKEQLPPEMRGPLKKAHTHGERIYALV